MFTNQNSTTGRAGLGTCLPRYKGLSLIPKPTLQNRGRKRKKESGSISNMFVIPVQESRAKGSQALLGRRQPTSGQGESLSQKQADRQTKREDGGIESTQEEQLTLSSGLCTNIHTYMHTLNTWCTALSPHPLTLSIHLETIIILTRGAIPKN